MVPSGSTLVPALKPMETCVRAVVTLSVNEATGGLSVIVLVEVVVPVLPLLSVTVNVTVYVPAVA